MTRYTASPEFTMWLLTLLLACPEPQDSKVDTGGSGDTASNVDRDGDGVPDASDCEPDDPNAYPGHYEVPYNGVDDDCDGVDTMDVDGDGFDGKGGGGDDCDDSNPHINPGEIEHCYDGLDNNCDGWEGGNDCDGDGFDVSHDCWDDEESGFENGGGLAPKDVYPGAPDTWYDGTDADCAGNNDFDQDADGSASIDYAGDDCVDTDALVNPAMDESWNKTDDDCDGLVDELTPSNAGMKVSGDTGRAEGDFGNSLLFLPDLDGDGSDDLVVGVPATVDADDYPIGYVWVLPNTSGIVTPSLEALGYLSGTGGTGTAIVLTEATSSPMVAVGSPWGTDTGAVDFYDSANIGDGRALARIEQDGGGGSLAALQDGRFFVGCTYGALSMTVSTWTSIVDATLKITDADASLTSSKRTCVDSGSFGDLDGDGLDETFVSGADADGAIVLYFARGSLTQGAGVLTPSDYENLGSYTQGLRFGWLADITGDGYDEAVITDPAADAVSTGDGRAWVVNGDAFTGAWTTEAFATLSGGTSGAGLHVGNLGDIVGDGATDLLLGLPGLGEVGFAPLATVVAGGDVLPSSASPSFKDSVGADLFGDAAWAYDFDHDLDDDLFVRTDRNAGGIQRFDHR